MNNNPLNNLRREVDSARLRVMHWEIEMKSTSTDAEHAEIQLELVKARQDFNTKSANLEQIKSLLVKKILTEIENPKHAGILYARFVREEKRSAIAKRYDITERSVSRICNSEKFKEILKTAGVV